MQQKQEEELSLASLAQGAAEELFAYELGRVLANIADVNTAATAEREIVVHVKFKPSKDRSFAPFIVYCTSKLAPTNPCEGQIFIGIENGAIVARESHARQLSLPGTGIELKGGK